MPYLIDTNILIRLAQRNDPNRPVVLKALRELKQQNEDLCYTTQVLVEFWNVCTRPITARGGLGLTIEVTERKAKLIEQRFRLLPESLATHQEWRRLVTLHSVKGVQVHDAGAEEAETPERVRAVHEALATAVLDAIGLEVDDEFDGAQAKARGKQAQIGRAHV